MTVIITTGQVVVVLVLTPVLILVDMQAMVESVEVVVVHLMNPLREE